MKRNYFISNNRNLSYIDFGGSGNTIITLHGHFGCASMYEQLANELIDSYRVIALDQQGHGFSDWGVDYSRAEYIEDIEALFEVLGIENAIIIGHSLGGVNGYQFAAKNPSKVKALVIEDIGARVDDDLSFILSWPKKFFTIRSCHDFLINQGINNYLYFMESLEQVEDGWSFKFDINGMVKSQTNLNGNWQEDWNKVECKVLLMRGEISDVLSSTQAMDIIKERTNIIYKEFKGCGHTIRDIDFNGYKNSIINFLLETVS